MALKKASPEQLEILNVVQFDVSTNEGKLWEKGFDSRTSS